MDNNLGKILFARGRNVATICVKNVVFAPVNKHIIILLTTIWAKYRYHLLHEEIIWPPTFSVSKYVIICFSHRQQTRIILFLQQYGSKYFFATKTPMQPSAAVYKKCNYFFSTTSIRQTRPFHI